VISGFKAHDGHSIALAQAGIVLLAVDDSSVLTTALLYLIMLNWSAVDNLARRCKIRQGGFSSGLTEELKPLPVIASDRHSTSAVRATQMYLAEPGLL
jgi:hypothetical protein